MAKGEKMVTVTVQVKASTAAYIREAAEVNGIDEQVEARMLLTIGVAVDSAEREALRKLRERRAQMTAEELAGKPARRRATA